MPTFPTIPPRLWPHATRPRRHAAAASCHTSHGRADARRPPPSYSLFTILAAALATAALTATLASILTHAVITGRVVLPPGLSNLGALFARILPGSDYRRTTTVDESPHRGDWTWAQPHRKEGTPRGISGTSSGQVSTPASGYGSM